MSVDEVAAKTVAGFVVWLFLWFGSAAAALGVCWLFGVDESGKWANVFLFQVCFGAVTHVVACLFGKLDSKERLVVIWAARVQIALGFLGLLVKWLK